MTVKELVILYKKSNFLNIIEFDEYLYMYLIYTGDIYYRDIIPEKVLDSLESLGMVRVNNKELIRTEKLNDLFTNSKASGLTKSEIKELAPKLRELWPKGKKSGKWAWRCSVNDCEEKLMRFSKKYPDITVEQILTTAQSYVNGFSSAHGYDGMQLLKYFILKDNSSTLRDEIDVISDGEEAVKPITTLV